MPARVGAFWVGAVTRHVEPDRTDPCQCDMAARGYGVRHRPTYATAADLGHGGLRCRWRMALVDRAARIARTTVVAHGVDRIGSRGGCPT